MSTLKTNLIQDLSGNTQYTAKAWVNFNGTGTVDIRASGNVSSITDNGVGDYTVNFTTAMPSDSYSSSVGFTGGNGRFAQEYSRTLSSIRCIFRLYNGVIGGADTECGSVAIFR